MANHHHVSYPITKTKAKNVKGQKGTNGKGQNPKGNRTSTARAPARVGNPGNREVVRSNAAPRAPRASQAWTKSLFDPAHCRSYGCVGIPDNNRDPTVVCCGRRDLMLSANVVPQLTLRANTESALQAKDRMFAGNYGKAGESEIFIDGSVALKSGCHWEKIDFIVHSNYGTIIMLQTAKQGLTYKSTSSDSEHTGDLLVCQVTTGVLQSAATGLQARPISASLTVDQITQWADMGGWFRAGHLPTRFLDYDQTISGTVVGGEQVYLGEWVDDADSYVTFTSGAEVGFYTISRPKDLDMLRLFGYLNDIPVNLGRAFGSTSIRLVGLTQNANAWDWAFGSFTPTAAEWTLRTTLFMNYEELRSYVDGGTDGAEYDASALNLVMAAIDKHDFIFAARDNDLRTVIPRVRSILLRYKKPILSAMGIAGAPSWVTMLIDKLLQ